MLTFMSNEPSLILLTACLSLTIGLAIERAIPQLKKLENRKVIEVEISISLFALFIAAWTFLASIVNSNFASDS